MTQTQQEFRREAQDTMDGLGYIAGTVCLAALLLIGSIGAVMVWAAMLTLHGAVRP